MPLTDMTPEQQFALANAINALGALASELEGSGVDGQVWEWRRLLCDIPKHFGP